MASNLRELRERRKAVSETKKITHAMELIASSRIIKAQQTARNALPYTRALTAAVSALASYSSILEHPLLEVVDPPRRSAMLLITGDRGLAGAYSSNVIKAAEQLFARFQAEGQEQHVQYITGKKGLAFFEFRDRPVEQSWTGFSDAPQPQHAREIAKVLLDRFLMPYEEGGVDQIHIVGTRFHSMLRQEPRAVRLLPLAVEDSDALAPDESPEILPWYEFEPDVDTVLSALLPMYVTNRVYTALLQSSASELASRQAAMKAATDNAQQLIERLTREANQARQAEITQEISEITGGASALAESAGNE